MSEGKMQTRMRENNADSNGGKKTWSTSGLDSKPLDEEGKIKVRQKKEKKRGRRIGMI